MPYLNRYPTSSPGFTLAELLIALAILGVIATFTIPKIITAQSNGTFNSAAKEDAAMVSAAFQTNRTKGSSTYNQSTFLFSDLTPYFNYVSVDTSSLLDNAESVVGSTDCSNPGVVCYKLANGSTIFWFTALQNFSGPQILFFVDPDGISLNSSATTGPSKSMTFYLSTTGSIQTYPIYTTSWFSW